MKKENYKKYKESILKLNVFRAICYAFLTIMWLLFIFIPFINDISVYEELDTYVINHKISIFDLSFKYDDSLAGLLSTTSIFSFLYSIFCIFDFIKSVYNICNIDTYYILEYDNIKKREFNEKKATNKRVVGMVIGSILFMFWSVLIILLYNVSGESEENKLFIRELRISKLIYLPAVFCLLSIVFSSIQAGISSEIRKKIVMEEYEEENSTEDENDDYEKYNTENYEAAGSDEEQV